MWTLESAVLPHGRNLASPTHSWLEYGAGHLHTHNPLQTRRSRRRLLPDPLPLGRLHEYALNRKRAQKRFYQRVNQLHNTHSTVSDTPLVVYIHLWAFCKCHPWVVVACNCILHSSQGSTLRQTFTRPFLPSLAHAHKRKELGTTLRHTMRASINFFKLWYIQGTHNTSHRGLYFESPTHRLHPEGSFSHLPGTTGSRSLWVEPRQVGWGMKYSPCRRCPSAETGSCQ